jgi:hypothetical protein
MKRLLPLVLVVLCGCSTAPVADFLDFFCPPRMPPGGRGGVCNPSATQPAPPAIVGRPGFPEPPPTDPLP